MELNPDYICNLNKRLVYMLKKVKNWLGIEGVKISITDIVTHTDSNTITGSVTLKTGSEQQIEALLITVKEKYTRGRRKSKLSDIYTIGHQRIEINEPILPAEEKQFNFEVGYKLKLSSVDRFGKKNVFNRVLAKTAKTLKGARSTYTCTTEVIVSGNKLKPYDTELVEL